MSALLAIAPSTARVVIQGLPMSHIALALSIFMLVVALPAIFAPKKFSAGVDEMLSAGNPVIRILGVINLLVAFFILNTHWTIKLESSRSIMTALGYLIALRGVLVLWFPEWARSMGKKMIRSNGNVVVMGFIMLLVAVGLGYLALKVY